MIERARKQSDTENKPSRYFSNIQEKDVAKKVSGKQSTNSGATPFVKGDVNSSDFLIECKTKMTESDSISIKRGWLEKNEKEALFMGKSHTALCFNYGLGTKNYYIINEDEFLEYVEFLKNRD